VKSRSNRNEYLSGGPNGRVLADFGLPKTPAMTFFRAGRYNDAADFPERSWGNLAISPEKRG